MAVSIAGYRGVSFTTPVNPTSAISMLIHWGRGQGSCGQREMESLSSWARTTFSTNWDGLHWAITMTGTLRCGTDSHYNVQCIYIPPECVMCRNTMMTESHHFPTTFPSSLHLSWKWLDFQSKSTRVSSHSCQHFVWNADFQPRQLL